MLRAFDVSKEEETDIISSSSSSSRTLLSSASSSSSLHMDNLASLGVVVGAGCGGSTMLRGLPGEAGTALGPLSDGLCRVSGVAGALLFDWSVAWQMADSTAS